MDELTWRCDVCKRERPDRAISVSKKEVDLGSGVLATVNTKYCNDDHACATTVGLGFSILGKIEGPLAYEGREDCTSPLCRRFEMEGSLKLSPGCIGWHCAICHTPSSQYGHKACREER